jgi:glucoamylase
MRISWTAPALTALLVFGAAINAAPGSTASAASVRTASVEAPGATPVAPGTWTTGGKDGIGTSAETHRENGKGVSKTWYTMSRGQLNEVYYPQVDVANVQDLAFLVTDGETFVDNERDDTVHTVAIPDPTALSYVQTNTAKNGRYRITKTYVTDPARSSVLIRTTFHANVGGLRLYVNYNPSLNNSSGGDTGSYDAAAGALVSRDGPVASALASSGGFLRHSTGYVGHPQSDGFQDIYRTKALTDVYDTAGTPGNIVQTAQIAVGGAGADTSFTLALGFGPDESSAAAVAGASLATGFDPVRSAYVQGWHDYLNGLFSRVPIPRSVAGDPLLRSTYTTSLMVLKAHEDKDHPGANVASLTVPWGEMTDAGDPNQAGYHHVWSRDLYHVATAQLAAGDRDAAQRSADYLFDHQQITSAVSSDGGLLLPGAFPRFSRLDGVTDRGCCEQLDQDAYPIILQWQLNHATPDPRRWAQVKLTADHIRSVGPSTPSERWEEIGGQSPSTIAAEIAGLVAAADLARLNGDPASAGRYESTADTWRDQLDGWTFTTTGTHGDGRYYERIDTAYNPNDDDRRCFKSGCFWERDIVDAGFLDLVRLGIRPADHPAIVESLPELDATAQEPNTRIQLEGQGTYWYRYNRDNYGEDASGFGWNMNGDRPTTTGRPWPLLSGERGEYVLPDDPSGALSYLRSMANAGGDGSHLIPEQIWDRADTTSNGIALRRGEHTGSATPLAWATAQYVRLALSIDAGTPVETPGVVSARYRHAVTLTVTVPPGTDATGKIPFIAGELGKLGGGYPSWVSGLAANGSQRADGERLTRVDATTWRITLAARPGASVAYKIALNPMTRSAAQPGWSTVEKAAECSEIDNRRLVVPASGRLNTAVTVANWAGADGC